ncbi:MAG TPA: hypothetical protein VK762_19230 [Polyangiaceae bacterium]|jgi:hypothetical protein|nr:hypothetical protein [Polyangiaceae bacterium]
MAADLDAVAESLFAGVMAPLVLGGPVRPGHAIGARTALALGDGRLPVDQDLSLRVALARLRRARRLAPVDAMPDPGGDDWALGAALHDLLQVVNPTFDSRLRRRAAARILDLAVAVFDRVPLPATAGQALSRHTWLARAPEVTRTDTKVRWWSGNAVFLGEDPPLRLQAWPQLRQVEVVRTPRPLLELTPLAVDRERLTDAVAALLARTPLTDLATCTRAAPGFAWSAAALNLIAAAPGRTLALRALDRLAPSEVDATLGRATRTLLAAGYRNIAAPALSLLGDRAVREAQRRLESEGDPHGLGPMRAAGFRAHELARTDAGAPADAIFARSLGALMARRALRSGEGSWPDATRLQLVQALAVPAQSTAAREASAILERSARGSAQSPG